MHEDDDGTCTALGQVAVYVAAGLDPETPDCEICGTGFPARFRLTLYEVRVRRLCALHLLTSVDDMVLSRARQQVGRLLADMEGT